MRGCCDVEDEGLGVGRDWWVRVRGCCDVEDEGLGVGRDW